MTFGGGTLRGQNYCSKSSNTKFSPVGCSDSEHEKPLMKAMIM
jgi:hypothetical protein